MISPILTRQKKSKLAALAIAAAAISLSPLLSASNITLTSLSGQPRFVSTAGDRLPIGSMVRIGFFSNLEDDRPTVQTATVPTVENLLSEIGTQASTAGSGNNSDGNGSAINDPFGSRGDVSVQVQNVNVAAPYAPATYTDGGGNSHDTQWAAIVYNHPDPANATEFGIFTSTVWLVPPSSLDAATLATGDIIEALRGFIAGGALHLEPIPEPSGISLIAASVAIVILKRRR
jgi:hypothetical protein